MKKILPIGYIMIAVLIILAASMMIFGPIIGNVFSETNNNLPGVSYAPMATASAYDQVTNSNDGSSVPAPNVKRIVIQNADLSIVVADVQVRMKDIQVMADKMGGFVVSSNLYQRNANNNVPVPEAQITIRVPSEKMEEALNQIKKDTVEVQTETRSGQDVTAEYVDLKSRLKNLEEAESQLSEILKNTINTEEVISIFNQLVAYREKIEVIKGQIKYYDEAAALSAISVSIVAEATVQPLVIGKWEPKGVALEAVQDLVDFLKGFVNFIIRFVIYTLPVWIMIGVPLYLIFIGARALLRKMRATEEKNEQPDVKSEK
jgi:hypothetical protein